MSIDPRDIIRSGDTTTLHQLISADPTLVHTRLDGQRSLLHVATDSPGHFPNVGQTITILITHGADVNVKFVGPHSETPLHWAASSNDVEALDALLDHGADIEAPGAVIGGGTPLADAVAFKNWRAAHRLIERGAIPTLWQSAALGLMDRVEQYFASNPAPLPEEINNALWCACFGGQLNAARYLVDRGGDLHSIGHDNLTPLDAASENGNPELLQWLRTRSGS